MNEIKKPWYKSKTLWFNVLGGAASMLDQQTGMLGNVLNPEETTALFGIGNIILRFLTNKKIIG